MDEELTVSGWIVIALLVCLVAMAVVFDEEEAQSNFLRHGIGHEQQRAGGN
jgi:hypothetical protein